MIMRRIKGFMLKRMHGMITCREFEDFVLSYLDDTLPPNQRKRFEWHMKICRECRDYLAAYQRTIELGQSILAADDKPLPDDVPEDLVQAILDARGR
ncbi:MAG: zf-HC2 domain-containing protein [Gammaproteobacteria bacterium]|nr:zf-HC2 domain-containing protein [Gammaproteobacteria bacterium]